MSVSDLSRSTQNHDLHTSRQVRDPMWICASVAAVEGLVVASVFMASAMLYHFILLQTAFQYFAAPLYIAFSLLIGLIYAGFSAVAASRFLDGQRRRDTTLPFSFFSWTIAFAAMLMIAFLAGVVGDLSRVSLTSAFLVGVPVVVVMRSLVQSVLSQQISQGELRFQKIALIGERELVLDFLLQSDLWRHGHELTNTLYLEDAMRDGAVAAENVAAFARAALQQGVRYIVITGDIAHINDLDGLISDLKRFSLNVVYAPAIQKNRIEFLDVVPIGPNRTLRVLRKPLSDGAVLLKRALDIVGAGVGLLALAPLLMITAALIRLDSPGPVIFRQMRRGFNGQPFSIMKFRTMTVTESGFAMTQATRDDARITRIGRFLRATSVDELPQLFNVLRGDMSLVGPRPHAISHDDELSAQLAQYAHRQRIKPGITGWAQVNGYRGETATMAQMQGRTDYDLYYIDNYSPFLDLWIILLTIVSPKTRRNAF
ncbi:exopolysaccharide biosynthesis polyprenyl glycosylphosphotransferase [Devosia sp. 63-57]|uniref:exopolysaccharide biosynthesis polyprenyl glycosylphosphotransferase n=1 Tax=Devosia sp. 63-57 TaxID=1895751 RepID=UPI00257D1328|nr:exopolysaccharide biosynthesis polyprenyl glycosylphosphotransferase [Devosia sp. 63-57]